MSIGYRKFFFSRLGGADPAALGRLVAAGVLPALPFGQAVVKRDKAE